METWNILWPQKVTVSLEVTVTYFMTPKDHRVIRGRLDLLYDPKGHGELCGQFDLVYDPKRSRGHKRSPWPTLWPQRSRWTLWSVLPSLRPQRPRGHQRSPWPTSWPQSSRWSLWSVWPSLWPQKVTGSLEVAVTCLWHQKVTRS